MKITTFPTTVWHLSRTSKLKQVTITGLAGNWGYNYRAASSNYRADELFPSLAKAIAAAEKRFAKRRSHLEKTLASIDKESLVFAGVVAKAKKKLEKTQAAAKRAKAKEKK